MQISWRRLALSTFSAACLCRGAEADQHIVLPPVISDPALPSQMLVLIPGGNVPNQHYAATAAAIQTASSSDLRLWVTIPAVTLRLCIVSCPAASLCLRLNTEVEAALSIANGKGWGQGSDQDKPWLAGHSLGGVCANTLFQAYHSDSFMPYAGLILMGSYVDETGKFDLVHYPKPVLILNTELDGGLARPGKTSVWWKQHLAIADEKGESYALSQKPVLVLQGLNHSDFCPGFDVPGDLPAEVSQPFATRIVGEVVAAFLHVQIRSASAHSRAFQLLRDKVTWTSKLLTPYLKAQELERMLEDSAASAEGSSPFCARAQHIVAGLSGSDDASLRVLDGFHVESSQLEHCHPAWNVTGQRNLTVTSCSHTDYYLDLDNTGSLTAASEIACKMLSSARVAQLLRTSIPKPKVECREGNRYAVEVAESLAAPGTLERFKRIGRGWCFESDEPTFGSIGPLWVFFDKLTLKENLTCMSVASPVLKTALDGHIYPGSHYCKFLSPARALDWMMTDSLKRPASRGGASSTVIV